MKKRTAKRKEAKPNARLEKIIKDAKNKAVGNEDVFLPPIDEVTDEQVRKSIFPDIVIPIGKGRGRRVACDSAGDLHLGGECEYNGPINLNQWREHLPLNFHIGGPVGKLMKHFAVRNFYLGDAVNGWLDQNCFIYKANDMPGSDAVSCGWEIVPRGTIDKKTAADIMAYTETEEFNLNASMQEFEHNKRCYGGAFMVPCFEEEVDMSMPLLDWSVLRGKTFLGWTNIEPYYMCPEFESGSRELNDPSYKFYMQPTWWNIYGSADGSNYARKVHRSWLFFRRNCITSRMYQPTYKFLGPSIPQMVAERLYSAEVCANESSMLLRSKRSIIIEDDVRKLAANPSYAEKFFKASQVNSDNWTTRVVRRGSNAKQLDTLLSECMPLTTAQYGILCAEVEIPCPKFMMAQLTGFANSGNYEIKLYANNVRKLISTDLNPIIRKTIQFYTACETGKAIALTSDKVKFGEIDIPTIVEQAEILYDKARATKFDAEAKALKANPQSKGDEEHHSVLERSNKK